MVQHRGFLVLLVLGATVAGAQERAVQPTRRRLVVSPRAESSPHVPELFLRPGTATTLHLPAAVRPDGLAFESAENKVRAIQPAPRVILLYAMVDLGPGKLGFIVRTEDGNRYPFWLTSRPDVWDSEVTVSFERSSACSHPADGSIMESLLNGQKVDLSVRSYGESGGSAGDKLDTLATDFYVKSAVRQGDLVFIQVVNEASAPWAVQEARLEGPEGVVLNVLDIRWIGFTNGISVNVIAAELPAGAGSDYTLESIKLTGRDGRVTALKQAVSLP
jgi:hypothetical protein